MMEMKILILNVMIVLFLNLAAFTQPSSATSPCKNSSDHEMVTRAFQSVANFNSSSLHKSYSHFPNCSIKELNLSSLNLSGIISWRFLRNMSDLQLIDLSSNSLQGYVPSWLWSIQTLTGVNLAGNRFGGSLKLDPISKNSTISRLQSLNISSNRFTNMVSFYGFPDLKRLDLSHNQLSHWPPGISNLTGLELLDVSNCNISGSLNPISNLRSLNYLDLSKNNLAGDLGSHFLSFEHLKFLNASFNHFTGKNPPENFQKFGNSAFIKAGNFSSNFNISKTPNPKSTPHLNKTNPSHSISKNHTLLPVTSNLKPHENPKSKIKSFLIPIISAASIFIILLLVTAISIYRCKQRQRNRAAKWVISTPVPPLPYKLGHRSGPFSFETESGKLWTAELKDPTSAPVVMLEKPLANFTFKDLIAATSFFGKDSQLAEGRSGPVYRAVLPGDVHVAIKVLESVRGSGDQEAVTMFEALGRVRHPNLLPISGYCIAGKEKLVLYDYMANGDLHRWLHELPTGAPNVEDWSTDTWEHNTGPAISPASSPEKMSWTTRHRIAVGIARGLAYLHHAGAKPILHGHLIPSNILLSDDFEPRIADYGMIRDSGETLTTEFDVYCYGLVLVELMTGQSVSDECVAWVRRLVKEGRGVEAVDSALTQCSSESAVKEMVEVLRVGYLCTAELGQKRPTMRQVVGLLKDIHPCAEVV